VRLQTRGLLQAAQQRLGVVVPEHASVLLARTADALDAVQGRVLLLEPGENQVNGLEPHGHRRKDLALVVIDEDALLQAILCAEVTVEVDFRFGEDVQVRLDYNGYLTEVSISIVTVCFLMLIRNT
jgi:hypothetical protein